MTSSCKWLSHSHTCTHFSKEGGGKGAVGLTLCEAPTCETRPDHYTGTSVPYSLRQLCGFFNVPCWQYDTEDAGDRAYNLSPVSKKTRTSPAWQSGALPTELTSREMTWHHIACENIRFSSLFAAKQSIFCGIYSSLEEAFKFCWSSLADEHNTLPKLTRKVGQICIWNPMTTGFIM